MSSTLTDEIIQFMSPYPLESILSGIIEMQMCLYGHNDTFIPVSEYLAANALYACKEGADKEFLWHDYELMKQYADKAFVPNVEQLFSKALKMVNATDEEKQAFLQSQMMQMKGNYYRGDGYVHQLLDVARRFYSPLDTAMKDALGFSYTSYEKAIKYIFSQYVVRIAKAYQKKRRLKTMIKALLKNEAPWLPSIREGYVFRIYKSELRAIIGDEVTKLCDYLSIKSCDHSFKKTEFEEFKTLISKPFVDFGEYIYLPLLFSTLMNTPKQFHYTFIAEAVFEKKQLLYIQTIEAML